MLIEEVGDVIYGMRVCVCAPVCVACFDFDFIWSSFIETQRSWWMSIRLVEYDWWDTFPLAVIALTVTNSDIVCCWASANGWICKVHHFLYSPCFESVLKVSGLAAYTLMPLPCPRLWLMAAIQPEKFPWVGASWLMQRRGEKKLITAVSSADRAGEGVCECAYVCLAMNMHRCTCESLDVFTSVKGTPRPRVVAVSMKRN